MRIFDLRQSCDGDATLGSARILPDGANAPMEVTFRFEGIMGRLSGLADALAVAMLTPAMFEGEDLVVEGPVSRSLLDNLDRAQAVLVTWYDYLRPIVVTASDVLPSAAPERPPVGVATCFTGGVDSWYSLLKHQSRISHLLLVRGFDIGLDNDALWQATCARSASVAGCLGKRLITCTTNLRLVADKRRAPWGQTCEVDFWGRCLHGAALASVTLALRDDVAELIVPASHTYANIFPWGSSPLLDPLWSNGHLTVVHDGCEMGRLAKTRMIAANRLALQTLRVCFADTSDYNCGRCEKCLRTMMALRACGALDRARSFSDHLQLGRVHRLRVPPQAHCYYEEVADAARRSGDHTLWRAAEAAIGRSFSLRHAVAVLRHGAAGTALGRALRARGGRIASLDPVDGSEFPTTSP